MEDTDTVSSDSCLSLSISGKEGYVPVVDYSEIILPEITFKLENLNIKLQDGIRRHVFNSRQSNDELILLSHIFSLFKEIEPYYWNHVDKIQVRLSFKTFLLNMFTYFELEHCVEYSDYIFDMYNEYKKRTTKAGAIITYRNGRRTYILLVKVSKSNLYSFPKGKHEIGETIMETAIREVAEETDLDIKPEMSLRTPKIILDQTVLYQINLSFKNSQVEKFTSPEITEVAWVPIMEISIHPENFSRMVRNAFRNGHLK